LEPLLGQLREVEGLREKSRGVFYRGSKAFLHFHEDGGELFADARIGTEFERFNVTTSSAQRNLLRQVQTAV
jgi:hypothetical protein